MSVVQEQEDVTANIVDVHPNVVQVTGADLRVTDRVFDVWGTTHVLTSVKRFGDRIRFRRDDHRGHGYEWIGAAETITILREESQ